MLGGGVFVTQNKTLPGSYINIVNASAASSAVGDRGVVAVALPLGKSAGNVIEITRAEFVKNSTELLGKAYDSADVIALREIFCHANKVYIYDLGTDGTATEAVAAFEPYEFNVLCAYTSEASAVKTYIDTVKSWRDTMGKKCQVVVYNQTKTDHESVINVVSTVSDEDADAYALVAWVAGAEAGCKINESCTNMLYDGEYTIVTDKTQAQLEECIENGQVAFHLVYGDVRLLEDINSLVTTTADKGEDFKSNQTIRVVDQIANDIAKLFNTKYLGRIPNNASGRVSLWADIVSHHKALESLNAIENFDSSLLTVEQGATKKSVVVNDAITVVNSMAQLYMTVVIR
jgi:hypothetical protein